jgi:phage shock protein A
MKGAWAAVIGGTLLLGGCASVDDVKRAQATADQALEAAHNAQGAADRAQQTADQAKAAADALNGRVTNIENDVNELKAHHRGQRG